LCLAAAAECAPISTDGLENIVGAITTISTARTTSPTGSGESSGAIAALGGKTQPRASELIGASRAEETVANIVFPLVAAYAENNGDRTLYETAKAYYSRLPAAPSNSVTRLASSQLFEESATARRFIKTTRQQQGLMQIFHDFCVNDKSACRTCQFPDLVHRWAAPQA